MTNPNDATRHHILSYFYERNRSATSQFGKKGSAAKISDVKKDLKELHGLAQQEVVANLNYLIDRGWVNSIPIEKTVSVKGGTIPSTVTWYQVAALGIDKIEGGSEFKPVDRYAGININATGSNVITLGDGNVVDARFEDLRKELEDLRGEVSGSDGLNDSEKLEAVADIDSLAQQLTKPEPTKEIVGALWNNIEKIAVAAGLVEKIASIAPHLPI